MEKASELFEKIKKLHQDHGASIPIKLLTPEIIQLLSDFKEEYADNWLDDEYIFALANIDRYNELIRILREQRKELKNGKIRNIKSIRKKYL